MAGDRGSARAVRVEAAPRHARWEPGALIVDYGEPRDVRAPISAMEAALAAEVRRLQQREAAMLTQVASASERLELLQQQLDDLDGRGHKDAAIARLAADVYQLAVERLVDAWEDYRAARDFEDHVDGSTRLTRLIADARELLATDPERDLHARVLEQDAVDL